MTLSQAINIRINDLCASRHITINKLCTISGITQSTLNNLINRDNKSTTVLTILRICRGLDIELQDFFNDDVFSDTDDD